MSFQKEANEGRKFGVEVVPATAAPLSSSRQQRVIGVDFKDLREHYEAVLRTVLRADPELVVICNSEPKDVDLYMAKTAWLSGHSVLLIDGKHLAPAGTSWLQHPSSDLLEK